VRYASQRASVVFPVHPRTRKNFQQFGLLTGLESMQNVVLTEPLGYLEFLSLMEEALMVITDSGGIQEETTYLQVPCLTFRTTTERPCTTEIGSNVLLSDLSPSTTASYIDAIAAGNGKKGGLPPLWDGKAAERIAEVFLSMRNNVDG